MTRRPREFWQSKDKWRKDPTSYLHNSLAISLCCYRRLRNIIVICLYNCFSVRWYISQTTWPNFTKFLYPPSERSETGGYTVLPFVCLCVCVCAHSVLADICTLWAPSSLYMFPVGAAQSFSGNVAIRYALPVLWMTYFHEMGHDDTLCLFLSDQRTVETASLILTKVCSTIKTSKQVLTVDCAREQSLPFATL